MHIPNLDTLPVFPALVPYPDLVLQMQIIKCLGKKEDQFWFKTYHLLHAALVFSSDGTFRTTPLTAQPWKPNVCLSGGWDWAW